MTNERKKDASLQSGFGIEASYYMPARVKRLLERVNAEKRSDIALYHFGDGMKWMYRILRENGITPALYDWRKKFVGYDCGGDTVGNVLDLRGKDTLLIACGDTIAELKGSIRFLIENQLDQIPVIYEHDENHSPVHQVEPYVSIAAKAKARARSMISDDQLFDLIQVVDATKDVEGGILEFGSLHGGSGAFLVEAANHYGQDNKKSVWLFDTFAGIPKSRYGLDHRWNGAFSNNSYSEVRNAFKDCDNVRVVQGNICETYKSFDGPVSLCYIASDTMESGEVLLNHFWPKLSPRGIITICDYGSYPNCIPLTVMTDLFIEKHPEAFVFRTMGAGIMIMKQP